MYKLIISPEAQKEIKKIKTRYQTNIKLAIEEIKENPKIGKPLTRELTGSFSYRIGFCRIIYKVDEKNKVINIITAGHRGNVYK